jgi:hypothetical protein
MVSAPEVRLSAVEIRSRFNAGRYAERATDDTDPSVIVGRLLDIGQAPAWAPAAARSQMIEYHDEHGRTIAWAHQYGYPNGTPINHRGRPTRPDPKFVFEEGTRFKYDPRLD